MCVRAARSKTRAWNLTSDRHAASRRAARDRLCVPVSFAPCFATARSNRQARARVPATASSRSRSCPRNTPSALRSGTLSWREIAASNARLRRRTRARGRGESSTRRRRRTASSFDSRRTSGSGAGPKRGSLQGSSPCDRRSDDACDEAGVMTRQRRTSKYAGRVKKAVPTNQIADVSLPVSRRRAGIASRWR